MKNGMLDATCEMPIIRIQFADFSSSCRIMPIIKISTVSIDIALTATGKNVGKGN